MLDFSTSLEQFTEQLSLDALGIDMQKHTIAIFTAFNEMSIANSGLEKAADAVKQGVLSRNYNAVTFNIPNLSDAVTTGARANKYAMPMRDNIADIIEAYAAMNSIDGFVFVANDAITVAGMMLGAMRVNLPSLFIGGGCMKASVVGDKKMGFNAAYETAGLLKSGKITLSDLEKMQKDLIKDCGNACDSYEANSSLIIAEALGLALPKASTCPADSKEREQLAFDTGVMITTMVKNVMTPRSIASLEALKMAACVDLAMGSSSTSVINLIAVSRETSNAITYDNLIEWKSNVPRIVNISTREQVFIEDFDAAGGVYAVLKQLINYGVSDGIYKIYDGEPMRDHVENLEFPINDVIKDMHIRKASPLRIVYGNLAKDGAIGFMNRVQTFNGTAKVFDSQEEALDAISARLIKAGDAVVIRNEGPVSAPGMRDVYLPVSTLVGLDLDKDVAVITDGRVPNISRGVVVGCVSPESGTPDGLLDVIQNGDIIEINLAKERINVKLTTKEIAQRKRSVVPRDANGETMLSKYAKTATPAYLGCLTDPFVKNGEKTSDGTLWLGE